MNPWKPSGGNSAKILPTKIFGESHNSMVKEWFYRGHSITNPNTALAFFDPFKKWVIWWTLFYMNIMGDF